MDTGDYHPTCICLRGGGGELGFAIDLIWAKGVALDRVSGVDGIAGTPVQFKGRTIQRGVIHVGLVDGDFAVHGTGGVRLLAGIGNGTRVRRVPALRKGPRIVREHPRRVLQDSASRHALNRRHQVDPENLPGTGVQVGERVAGQLHTRDPPGHPPDSCRGYSRRFH